MTAPRSTDDVAHRSSHYRYSVPVSRSMAGCLLPPISGYRRERFVSAGCPFPRYALCCDNRLSKLSCEFSAASLINPRSGGRGPLRSGASLTRRETVVASRIIPTPRSVILARPVASLTLYSNIHNDTVYSALSLLHLLFLEQCTASTFFHKPGVERKAMTRPSLRHSATSTWLLPHFKMACK